VTRGLDVLRSAAAAALRVAAALAAATFLGDAAAADINAGRAKAQVCIACHGPEGNSVDPATPSLAGQPQQFLATALVMFREGNRKNPLMTPLTANLTNADLNDIAAYFSTQKSAPPARPGDPQENARGKLLAEKYNCVQCHGPALLGQQHIPRLAGQQPEYLRAQLRGFKSSTRFDMDGQMTSAAQALSDEDIGVLVDFLSTMR
jgi:cytochrome c553